MTVVHIRLTTEPLPVRWPAPLGSSIDETHPYGRGLNLAYNDILTCRGMSPCRETAHGLRFDRRFNSTKVTHLETSAVAVLS